MESEFAAVQSGFNLLPTPQTLSGSQQNYAVDTGAVNAVVVPFPANVTSLTDGMEVVFKAAYSNTGSASIVVGTVASTPIVRADATATQAGDYLAGQVVVLRYNASSGAFQLTTLGPASVASVASSAAASAASAASSAASAAVATVAASVSNALRCTTIMSLYQNYGAF